MYVCVCMWVCRCMQGYICMNTIVYVVCVCVCVCVYARVYMHEYNCIYIYMNVYAHTNIWKEGSVLFNDTLNTFYLWLYGVRHMVKDHSDSERGNLLPPHGLLFLISSKGSFICTIPQTGYHIPQPLLHQSRSTGWNEKQLNESTMKDRSDDPLLHEQTLLPHKYMDVCIKLYVCMCVCVCE